MALLCNGLPIILTFLYKNESTVLDENGKLTLFFSSCSYIRGSDNLYFLYSIVFSALYSVTLAKNATMNDKAPNPAK